MDYPGLPPLPKSLSTFNVDKTPPQLDTQMSVLRREMYLLRQQDLSLLSQLWSLNESLQEFRLMLQDSRVLSPPSPESSVDSDEYFMSEGTPPKTNE